MLRDAHVIKIIKLHIFYGALKKPKIFIYFLC